MDGVAQPLTSDESATCGDVTTSVRLLSHVKENNIAYLIGVLVCYQIGLLDKVLTYGAGVCT